MSEEVIQQLETNIQQDKKLVELGASLERLRSNRDFKKVILEGYFEQEAVRLVHLKADPNMQSADSQKSIVSQMDAIGSLAQYFYALQARSSMANKSLEANVEMRDEILAEGA